MESEKPNIIIPKGFSTQNAVREVTEETPSDKVVTPADTKIEEAAEEYASNSAYMAKTEVKKLLIPVAMACRVARMQYLENKHIRLGIMDHEDVQEMFKLRKWFTDLGVEKQKRIGKYIFDMSQTVDDETSRAF